MSWRVIEGDCVAAMAEMEADSADSIITDPPYGLSTGADISEVLRCWLAGEEYQHKSGGFMGASWDSFTPGPEYWRAAYRVAKPGAHLAAFGGTRTFDLLALSLRLAGWEIRDSIAGWHHGNGFPKSLDVSKALDKLSGVEREVASVDAARRFQGYGTALKPSFEPILLARKPLRGSVAANVERYGTGALNIAGSRVGAEVVSTRGLVDTRHAPSASLGASWHGGVDESPREGRYPPNTVFIHSPECEPDDHHGEWRCVEGCPVLELDMQSGRLPAGDGRDWSGRGEHGVGGVTYLGVKSTGRHYSDAGTASRFFPQLGWEPGEFEAGFLYTAKASRSERERGLEAMEAQTRHRVNPGGLEHDPRWAPVQRKNTHATVKPIAIFDWLLRLLMPPGGGLVVDPFAGSGTLGIPATRRGFDCVLIEQEPAHVAIARGRIAGDAPLLNVEAPPTGSSAC